MFKIIKFGFVIVMPREAGLVVI